MAVQQEQPQGEIAPSGASQNGSALVPTPPAVPEAPRRVRRRWLVLVVVAAVAAVLLVVFGIPWVRHYFRYETTDDAYLNSYVTYVSPRISGVVSQVEARDNRFVRAGDVLVQLDDRDYRVAVDQKKAALDQALLTIRAQAIALQSAQIEVEQARNQARSQLAGLRASWFLLRSIQTLAGYGVASLRASNANLEVQKRNLVLAKQEHDRVARLYQSQSASQEELEQREATLRVAQQQVVAAEEGVQQSRALLGLERNTKHPLDMPKHIEEDFFGVQYALASGQQILAQLGVPFKLFGMDTSHLAQSLADIASQSSIDQTPGVKLAETHLRQAQEALGGSAFDPAHPERHPSVVKARKELEEAELKLGYATIRAPISGLVSSRAVNPGNHVQVGQTLLQIRPLGDAGQVWVDANFKETQLQDIVIGLPVDLYVDAYPHHVFHGRVAGLSAGTGAAQSLLPPENASGNFVKVVQRVPVRIELTEPIPEEAPLRVGLSVDAEVDVKAAPTGPQAGQRLFQPSSSGDRRATHD
ncbi:MAG TPA: HlyD family secretion protein [Gemmataceae bacterium]|nr:HlyD family secretion protein [Gemmataceae bacterium]